MNCPEATPVQERAAERQRLRMLYSLGDFRLALSAAAFLSACDPDTKYSKAELRRFRCYETAAIISYARPFSQSKGSLGSLSLKMTGAQLSDAQKALHDNIMYARNKAVAHSDYEMMRMVAETAPMKLGEDCDFNWLHVVFDEGVTLIGMELFRFQELLHVVHGALLEKLILQAQRDRGPFDIHRDYLLEP